MHFTSNLGADGKQSRCFCGRWYFFLLVTHCPPQDKQEWMLASLLPVPSPLRTVDLDSRRMAFTVFVFMRRKIHVPPLQSKHSGSSCDCSDFFKDLDATSRCFSTAGNIMKLKSLVELFFSFFQPWQKAVGDTWATNVTAISVSALVYSL